MVARTKTIPKIAMNHAGNWKERVEQLLNSRLVALHALSDSTNSATYCATASSGQQFFIKLEFRKPGLIEAEVKNLQLLRSTATVRVPQLFAFVDDPQQTSSAISFLVLEFFESAPATREHQRAAGEMLAQLHAIASPASHTGPGLEWDNFIGRMPQLNRPIQKWSRFFVECRIEPQLKWGVERGWINKAATQKFEVAFREIEQQLSVLDADSMSLLHGDLWSGNLMYAASGPVFVDPACYCGHREAELAFTYLFGGFGREFYRGYDEAVPLRHDFDDRLQIHNLYHLMNHANLFGGSYISQSLQIVNSLS